MKSIEKYWYVWLALGAVAVWYFFFRAAAALPAGAAATPAAGS